ncbi:DNA helicase INO80 isoform X3 [Tanacetum coccineum]
MTERSNVTSSEKRKRQNVYSSDEDADGGYDAYITEERYRAMLGEHVKKYKRRHMSNSLSASGSGGRVKNETYYTEYGMNRSVYEPAYLDIGDGVTYKLPPTYEMLATSLNLPTTLEMQFEEFHLSGTLDLGSLASIMSADKRLGSRSGSGMGEPKSQYESLLAKLSFTQKFSLKVSDAALDSYSAPEGAAGGFRRFIMSESGVLQVHYVKVLEKGDTYEIIERSLPKKSDKKDPSVIEKEEMNKVDKYWLNLVRKDIPKHHRLLTNFHRKQLTDAKRFSEYCQREVKMKVSRSLKLMRGASIRTRKLARDMLVFWKRVDKEMVEVRKREEKEAAEALKREQELREARRQEQRLNFLLSQTELYGHFMQNKSASQPTGTLGKKDNMDDQEGIMGSSEDSANEEDPEEAEMKMEALKAAQDAFSKQQKITNAFDDEYMRLRQASGVEDPEEQASVTGSSNIDLLNPSTMPVASSVETPKLFKGSLKEYQLKGLQWLVNCYEQGLNGILADEMGLGKTIQAMAFLAHLAEEKNIWGPFLVVAPTSVLNNWADEISRFCPDLKTLPYWGGIQDRTVLRKKINPKRLYRRSEEHFTKFLLDRDAGFHILITSYQLLVSDEKYFRRVKWQYMVLDEAQAIKSSTSIRWKTLLSFNCRNRLLLTGTPVQNNMAELWALLHFIMPTLFDSHEQFSEWFSKGIENHAEHGGTLNEHQLSRLVCNHPELFERNEGSSSFYFGDITNPLLPPPFGELENVYYSGSKNPIMYKIPKLIYQEVVRSSGDFSSGGKHDIKREFFEKHFNIFSPVNIYRSIFMQDEHGSSTVNGAFGFTRLINLSPAETSFIANSSLMERLLFSVALDGVMDLITESEYYDDECNHIGKEKVRAVTGMLLMPSKSKMNVLRRRLATGPTDAPYEGLVLSHEDRLASDVRLLHSAFSFIPPIRAPPIDADCADRDFAYRKVEELHHPWIKRLLLGFARTSAFSGPRKPDSGPHHLIEEIDKELPVLQPALQLTHQIFGSCPPMQSFDPAKMLTDSGKLQTLDILLKRLRAGNHRVLLFAQMTKMLNIIEDYMNYRKYKYLRLDGSSTITDRRDMVRDFQLRLENNTISVLFFPVASLFFVVSSNLLI